MTNKQDARLDKIQKLLRKAEGTGTEEEAAAFFAKAEELMTKYAIDDAMLQASGKMEREEVSTKHVKIASTYFDPDRMLISGIGRAHNVKLLQNKQGKYVVLVGFPSDIENTIMLYNLLQVQAARFAREAMRNEPESRYGTAMDQYVWRRSFREGFASRVAERLKEQKERTTEEAVKAQTGSGMELVLVDRKKQVDQFFSAMGKGKVRGGNTRYNGSAGAAGRRAGNRADISNKRVGGRKAISR